MLARMDLSLTDLSTVLERGVFELGIQVRDCVLDGARSLERVTFARTGRGKRTGGSLHVPATGGSAPVREPGVCPLRGDN